MKLEYRYNNEVDPASVSLLDESGNVLMIQSIMYDGSGESKTINKEKSFKHLLNVYEFNTGQNKLLMESIPENITYFRDDVYIDGAVARHDYSINSTNGLSLVEELESSWPDFIPNYRISESNLISEFTPIRQPYVNDSISLYNFELPSAELITQYGLEYGSYLPFYGLKFDKTTSDVLIKIMISPTTMAATHPDLCTKMEASIPIWGSHFFGLIYNSAGTIDPMVDVYFTIEYERAVEWCNSEGLPIPYDDETLNSKCIHWGGTYDSSTEKFVFAKGYIRNYLEE